MSALFKKGDFIMSETAAEKLGALSKQLQRRDDCETQLAFVIADRYISILEVDDGYDYSIMGPDYKEIDGGVYDNKNVGIRDVLEIIVTELVSATEGSPAKGSINENSALISIDFDELMKNVKQ